MRIPSGQLTRDGHRKKKYEPMQLHLHDYSILLAHFLSGVLCHHEAQHALLGEQEPAVLLTCTNDLSISMRRITNSFFPYTEGCLGRSFLSRRGELLYK